MLSTSLNLSDRANPALQAKIAKCSGARLNAFIGPRLVLKVQGHFLRLPHNKRGWSPVNFWPDAARATNWEPTVEGVLLKVNKIGVRQRLQGGVIKPVHAKALTIPVAEEAYGKTAADFGDRLQLVVIKGKGAWLALRSFSEKGSGKKGRRKKGETQGAGQSTSREQLKFLFRLCAGIEQDANPDVFPTDEELLNEAIAGAEEAIK